MITCRPFSCGTGRGMVSSPGFLRVARLGAVEDRAPHRGRGGCDMMCTRYVEYVLEKEGDIAAVIAEPIRSIPSIPKPEYWQIIRKACDRHGALLIFDEIPHALGRTGRMFTGSRLSPGRRLDAGLSPA
jgi:4-aminobutyrate aminotransferase